MQGPEVGVVRGVVRRAGCGVPSAPQVTFKKDFNDRGLAVPGNNNDDNNDNDNNNNDDINNNTNNKCDHKHTHNHNM